MSSSSADPKIFVLCTDCTKQLKVPISWVGKMIKCPGCETHFLAEKRTPEEQAALLPKKKKSSLSSSKFVEDRKGAAEFQALGLGIGLAVAGAALSLGLWYMIAMQLQSEARFCSLAVGAAVGIGMYAGYRKADAAMGALAALLAVGVAVGGIFMMYHSFADSVAGALGANDLKGPRSVWYGKLFAEKASGTSAANLLIGSEKEQSKAHRELQKVQREVAAEVGKMSDAEIVAKIRESEAENFKEGLTDFYVEAALRAKGLTLEGAADDAVAAEQEKASERVVKMKPADIEAAYLKQWSQEGREEVAMQMSEVDEAIAIRDKKFTEDDNAAKSRLLNETLVKHRETVAGLSGFDLYMKKLEVEEELSQVGLSAVKNVGNEVAGMSLMSPRTAFWLLAVGSIAFGFATGGRFAS